LASPSIAATAGAEQDQQALESPKSPQAPAFGNGIQPAKGLPGDALQLQGSSQATAANAGATPEAPYQQQLTDSARSTYQENLSKNEYRVMRAFLLSSQLSVVVATRELKCMIIKQQDKAYFSESIKKIFDERSAQLEFLDIDRPMKEVAQIEKIRLDNHKWDLFKREYGHAVLQDLQTKRGTTERA